MRVQVQGGKEMAIPCPLSPITHHPSLCRVEVGVGVGGQKNQGVGYLCPSMSILYLNPI